MNTSYFTPVLHNRNRFGICSILNEPGLDRLGSDTADGGTADGVAAGAVADVVTVAGGLEGTADGPGVAAGEHCVWS